MLGVAQQALSGFALGFDSLLLGDADPRHMISPAEDEGFEPSVALTTLVFKTNAFGR